MQDVGRIRGREEYELHLVDFVGDRRKQNHEKSGRSWNRIAKIGETVNMIAKFGDTGNKIGKIEERVWKRIAVDEKLRD